MLFENLILIAIYMHRLFQSCTTIRCLGLAQLKSKYHLQSYNMTQFGDKFQNFTPSSIQRNSIEHDKQRNILKLNDKMCKI